MPSKYLSELLVSTDLIPSPEQGNGKILRFMSRFDACCHSMYSEMHKKIAFGDPAINSFTLFLTEAPESGFRINGTAFLVDVTWEPNVELYKEGNNEFFGHLVCNKFREAIDKASEYEQFPSGEFYKALENYESKDYDLLLGHSKLSVSGAKIKLEILQFLNCVSTTRKLRVTHRGKTLLEVDAGHTETIRTVVAMDQPEAVYRDGVLCFKPYDDWWLSQWKDQKMDWSDLQKPIAVNIKADHEEVYRFLLDNDLVEI